MLSQYLFYIDSEEKALFFSASFVVGIYLKGLKINVNWGELSDDMARGGIFLCIFAK